jgi:hypothetical protein
MATAWLVAACAGCSTVLGIGELNIVGGDAGREGGMEQSDAAGPGEDAAGPAGDGSSPHDGSGDAGAVAPPPTPCTTTAECGTGRDCVGQFCVMAPASCGALQILLGPSAADGLYWIVPPGSAPTLEYCDMRIGQDLCDGTLSVHTGQMRDGSMIGFNIKSVLVDDGGAVSCRIGRLYAGVGVPFQNIGQVCTNLGFNGTPGQIVGCAFGPKSNVPTADQSCGYTPTGCTYNGTVQGYDEYVMTCTGSSECMTQSSYYETCISDGTAIDTGMCGVQ